jgi:hypothetical protein
MAPARASLFPVDEKAQFGRSISQGESGLFTIGVVQAVPEPSTWAMMLLGFAALGFAFRQSRCRVSFMSRHGPHLTIHKCCAIHIAACRD